MEQNLPSKVQPEAEKQLSRDRPREVIIKRATPTAYTKALCR